MILLIDNYDSFSFNLYQMIGMINSDIKVIRNDEMTIDDIDRLSPSKIIISPGPGRPENAGIIVDLVNTISKRIPTLGVCLGHQAICKAFGGNVVYAKKLMHGKQSNIKINNSCELFKNCPSNIDVARYHSLVVEKKTLPDSLDIIAETEEEEVMAVKHKEYPIYGVQFHPESIMTPFGKQILINFLKVE